MSDDTPNMNGSEKPTVVSDREQEELLLLWRHCVAVMRSLRPKLRKPPCQCPLCGSVVAESDVPHKKFLTITGKRPL